MTCLQMSRFGMVLALTFNVVLAKQNSCDTLTCAIIAGDDELVKVLLEQGVDPSAEIPRDSSDHAVLVPPVMLAMKLRHESIAIRLLEAGANPTLGATTRLTALDYAVSQDLEEIVKYVIKNSLLPIDGFATGDKPYVPLGYAAALGNTRLMQYLLEQGADPKKTGRGGNNSVLDGALSAGRENIARMLMDRISVETLADSKRTLTYAARESNHRFVSRILEAGADPNQRLVGGATSMEQGVQNCHHQERVVKALLGHGADFCVQTMSGQRLRDDEAVVNEKGVYLISPAVQQAFIEHSNKCWADITVPPKRHSCAGTGSIETHLECLVEANDVAALMEIPSTSLQSALTEQLFESALLRDSQEIVIASLGRVPPLACQEVNNMPLFHRSMVLGRFRVLNQLMMEQRWCKEMTGFSPLHTAVLELNFNQTQNLINAGAQADVVDNYGFTPLMFALALGAEDIAYLLIEFGADINRKTNFGHTALHFALLGDAHMFDRHGLEFPMHQLDVTDTIDGRTPLLVSAASECPAGDTGAVLYNGADKCLKDKYGKNFFSYLEEESIRPQHRLWAEVMRSGHDNHCP